MATRKPMINASPILSPRNGEEGAFLGRTKVFSRNGMAGGHGQTMVMNCANPNHLNKKAEYNIEVDG